MADDGNEKNEMKWTLMIALVLRTEHDGVNGLESERRSECIGDWSYDYESLINLILRHKADFYWIEHGAAQFSP